MNKISTLSQLPDEALCALAAQGGRAAEETLVVRYYRLVRVCSRPFFLVGGDSEDLLQEGMVGLLAAVREYDPARGVRFRTYAEVCIKNRLISAIKAAAKGVCGHLNNYPPFETPLYSGNDDHYAYSTDQNGPENPEDLLISREAYQERLKVFKGQLSGFEAKVLDLYLDGLSYSEIAAEIDKSPKSVDNAVQRIRRKLAQQFSSGEISES